MLRRTTLLLLAAAAAVLAAVGVSSATGSRDDDRATRPAALAASAGADRGQARTVAARRGDRAGRRALLRDVRRAVLAGAPAAAAPVIDAAVRDGRLTETRAADLRAALADLTAGKRPRPARLRVLLLDAPTRAVALDVARALAQRAPALAAPVLDAAVRDGRLTERRAARLRAKAARFARRLADPANGVFLAVGAAVVREAPGIAGPVLDRAVADDRLTRQQADAVLDAIRTLDGRRAAGAVALDPDARGVARELAKALAARVPGIADPILADAVRDGTLTERRAERVRRQIGQLVRRAARGR